MMMYGKHVIKKKKNENELIKFSRALALLLARTLYLSVCRKFEMSKSADREFGMTDRRLMYACIDAYNVYAFVCLCVSNISRECVREF